MNRQDLQLLAGIRIREARTLRDAGLWNGCYYMAGHAVECALKAVIARSIKRFDFPDKRKADDCYSHDLTKLLRTAGLQTALNLDSNTHPSLGVNWATAKDWKVEARYNRHVSQTLATDLLRAVAQNGTGVVAWLRKYW